MDAQLEIKLIECLDALAQGEALERILARYPQESAELRPLLETATNLSVLRREPSEAAKMHSRQKFMAQADLLRRTAPRQKTRFLPRFAVGFSAALLAAIVLGTGAVAASGTALPGDPLYGLKRTVENVQLSSAGSPTQRQELQREFDQRRREEANELLNDRRESEVEFTGTIEVLQPKAWIVSGLVVRLDTHTQISGTPQINRVAEVRGTTGPNGLQASAISIEPSERPESTSTPEATEAPPITPTAQSTLMNEPTMVVKPKVTATLPPPTRPRPTRTPPPTATPQPSEVDFTGNVTTMDAGTWNIDGTTITVNANTEIRSSISVGQRVKVRALRYADGNLIATRIELVTDNGGGNNSNGNENQNGNDNNSSGHGSGPGDSGDDHQNQGGDSHDGGSNQGSSNDGQGKGGG